MVTGKLYILKKRTMKRIKKESGKQVCYSKCPRNLLPEVLVALWTNSRVIEWQANSPLAKKKIRIISS